MSAHTLANRISIWLAPLALALLCPCLLSAGSPAVGEVLPPEYNVWVVSDIHYLAESLHDGGSAYASLIKDGDNKNLEMVGPLLDALCSALKKEVAEGSTRGCLVIAGDLTLNGELASHVELGERLKALSDAGIPVYVFPGNHDLNNPLARSYLGDSAEKVEAMSAGDFERAYGPFGYGQALSRDGESLSYLVEPRPGLRLLLLDSTSSLGNSALGYASSYGEILPSTMEWMRRCALGAEADGARLVVAMHHSLIDHNAVIHDGYTIANSAELISLLSDSGVDYILTGHTHIQDIAEVASERGPIYDITTGALSVYPHNYGQLRICFDGRGSMTEYSAHRVDVEAFARASGESDSRLLDFNAYAESFFRDRAHSMMARLLSACAGADCPLRRDGSSEECESRLVDLLVTLNTRFFSGNEELNEADGSDLEVERLLRLIPDGFLCDYARSIVADSGPGDNEIELP